MCCIFVRFKSEINIRMCLYKYGQYKLTRKSRPSLSKRGCIRGRTVESDVKPEVEPKFRS